ncbi:MAG: c-type cytochrome [Betaproteobacteria bacterium]|nr:c-type cytochrome [Betaproteobacteria bacterium]
MKQAFIALAAAAGILGTGVAQAADAKAAAELMKKHVCTTCHEIDKKKVGPAYKDVAAKYRGQKDIAPKLVEKVRKGGIGAWGQVVPMPPNPNVSEADAKALVDWILSLK